jgi:hypothetical protein
MRHVPRLTLALLVALGGACGSSTSGQLDGGPGCVPHQGVTCFGRGGCAGWQICAADGTAYSECICFGADGGPAVDGPAPPADGPRDAAGHAAPASADAALCSGEVVSPPLSPLDIYIMLDQSGSMADTTAGGLTKWSAVATAIISFVNQPGLDGTSVGLQYFGVPPGGAQCTVASCSIDADCGAGCGPCDATFGCVGYGASDSCKPQSSSLKPRAPPGCARVACDGDLVWVLIRGGDGGLRLERR